MIYYFSSGTQVTQPLLSRLGAITLATWSLQFAQKKKFRRRTLRLRCSRSLSPRFPSARGRLDGGRGSNLRSMEEARLVQFTILRGDLVVTNARIKALMSKRELMNK